MKKYIIAIILTVITTMILCCCGYEISEEDSNTETIKEYEVLTVCLQFSTETNNWGAITDQDMCYYFTYLDENGELQEREFFRHSKYGNSKIKVGKENKYIIGDFEEETLVLTKETLRNISMK